MGLSQVSYARLSHQLGDLSSQLPSPAPARDGARKTTSCNSAFIHRAQLNMKPVWQQGPAVVFSEELSNKATNEMNHRSPQLFFPPV